MKRSCWIVLLFLLALTACDATTREARRMVKRAERLADTLPDSTVRLIDSVLRMPASFSERERMDMALLQAEALFGCRDVSRNVSKNNDTLGDVSGNVSTISPIMDDDFFDDRGNVSTSPELERAAAYYARKKQYGKAAHAALYSGFVQQHYDEKEAAMRSFKEAEHYGMLATDSLTIAQAQYKMGKMLYNDEMEKDAVTMLLKAFDNFGHYYTGKALTQNLLASCYIILNQCEQAEISLNSSMYYAEKVHFSTLKVHILNNYAVLCRLQKRYDDALMYLRQIVSISDLNETELFVYYLNLGKAFSAVAEMDSALLYFKHVEDLLLNTDIKKESRISAYGALSQFAEQQEDIRKALQYKNQREELLATYLSQRQEQVVYRIQKLYDYESLQNEMNRKLIRRQRVITFFGILTIIGLTALAISLIRLAKIRKEEAIAKANLFHFMQQNKELLQKQETTEKKMMGLSMANETNLKAYQDLSQKYQAIQGTCKDYAQTLSDALNKEALIMRKLDIYLGNKGEKAYLAALNEAVFEGDDHWEALMKVFDALYPNVRDTLLLQYPNLTEMEQKDFILSYFNVSREDEAAMFNKSVHTVDKWRNGARKKMQKKEETRQDNN